MNDTDKINKVSNNAKSFKRFFSVKTILLLFILIVLFRMIYWNLGHKETRASDLSLENIIQAINNERVLRNLSVLKEDSRLSSAAQSKAQDMQTRHYFSHTDPEGNYIWPKIVAAGYSPYLQLGENLAIEFYNTESLVAAWMNSPTHKANVLNEGFKDQGMGLEFGNSSEGKYHSAIVNTFGSLVAKKVVTQKPPEQTPKTEPTPISKPQTLPASTPTTPPPPPVNAEPQTSLPTQTPKTTYVVPPTNNAPSIPLVTIEQKPNFATPEQQEVPTTATSATTTIKTLESVQSQPEEETDKTNINVKRYLSITLTVLLILFVISDIKEALEKKLQGLDKKVNNLILLILALVVIAFLYWL